MHRCHRTRRRHRTRFHDPAPALSARRVSRWPRLTYHAPAPAASARGVSCVRPASQSAERPSRASHIVPGQRPPASAPATQAGPPLCPAARLRATPFRACCRRQDPIRLSPPTPPHPPPHHHLHFARPFSPFRHLTTPNHPAPMPHTTHTYPTPYDLPPSPCRSHSFLQQPPPIFRLRAT